MSLSGGRVEYSNRGPRNLRPKASGIVWDWERIRLLLPALPDGDGVRYAVVPIPWVGPSQVCGLARSEIAVLR